MFGFADIYQDSYLTSPPFDFTNISNPVFSARLFIKSSNYFKLQYSTDTGATWTYIGTSSDPFWYDSYSGWTTAELNWRFVLREIPELAGEPYVLLRFRYYSSNYSGKLFVDDIAVFDKPTSNLGIVNYKVEKQCLNTSTSVLIINSGTVAQSHFQLSWSLDSGNTFSTPEIIDTILNPQDTIRYTFNNQPIYQPGNNRCLIKLECAGDEVLLDDTISFMYSNFDIANIPYFIDFKQNELFEGFIDGWYSGGCSFFTDPSSGEKSIYLSYNDNLTSPCITDTSTVKNLKFKYYPTHLTSSSYSYPIMKIDYFDTAGTLHSLTQDTVDFLNSWGQLILPLPDNIRQVKFSTNNNVYYAIDSISFFTPTYDDIKVLSISYTACSCYTGNNDTIKLKIVNMGGAPVSNIPVTYSLDSGITFIPAETISDTIMPCDTMVYAFSTLADFSSVGYYHIIGKAELPTDTILSNNEAYISYFSHPTIYTFPFLDDFEGQIIWQWRGADFSWELGTPSTDYLFTTYSGNNAWVTDLDSLVYNYNGNHYSYLESPCFDFSSLNLPVLEMAVNYNFLNHGFFEIVYSIDAGRTWQIIEPNENSDNWLGFWYVNSNGWQVIKTILPELAGEPLVQFRIKVEIDAYSSIEGVAIDDFSIYDSPAKDFKVVDVSYTCQCFDTASSPVIIVRNLGSEPQWNIPVCYSIDGGNTFSSPEFITDTVASYQTDTFNFSPNMNWFSAPGNYNITGKVMLAGDVNSTNDTLFKEIKIYQTIDTFPYYQDFEGTQNWFTYPEVSSQYNYNSTWEIGNTNGFLSLQSGNNAWITNLTDTIYGGIEHSYLQSPCFDFSNLIVPVLEFDYRAKFITSSYFLSLQYSTDFGITWSDIPDYYFTNCDTTGHATVYLYGLGMHENISFRYMFVGKTFNSYGRVAIDNICVHGTVSHDASIYQVKEPKAVNLIGLNPLIVSIVNVGSDTIYNLNIKLSVDSGSTFITEAIHDTIGILDTLEYTTTSLFDFSSPGPYYIEAIIELTNDTNSSNDTAHYIFFSQPYISSYPYFQNFDSSQYWIFYGDNSPWAIGTPGYYIDSAYSTPNACYIFQDNIKDNYVESPYFDFSNFVNPRISFYYNVYYAEQVQLEFSIDTGKTWHILEGDNQLYNGAGYQWTGTSNGWVKAKKNLSFLNGNPVVKFRFHFHSTNVYSYHGFAFDDFKIQEGDSCELELLEFVDLDDVFYCRYDTLTIKISNNGSSPICNYSLKYSLDSGLTYVEEIIPDTLFPGDTIVYSFSTLADFTQPNTYNVIAVVSAVGDTILSNDTIRKQIITYPLITTYPYEQDFEGLNDWHPVNNTTWECGTPQLYLPPGVVSGNKAWVTKLDTSFNESLYNHFILESPYFDLSGLQNPVFEFDLFSFLTTSNCSKVTLEWLYQNQFSQNYHSYILYEWGSTNDCWEHQLVNVQIPNYISKVGRFRIKVDIYPVGPAKMRHAVGIDNVIIKDSVPDLALVGITMPTPVLPQSSNIHPTIEIKNTGNSNLSNFSVSYSVDSGLTFTTPETITSTIQPLETDTYSFSSGCSFSNIGWHKVVAVVKHNQDSIILNDTLSYDLFTVPKIDTFPYFDDFEGNRYWYNYKYPEAWQLGVPQKTHLNSTHSGNHAWCTNLTNRSLQLRKPVLYSPVFDFSNLYSPVVEFYLNKYDYEDSLILQYSTDSIYWKNAFQTRGTNSNFEHISIALPFLSQEEFVQFRFVLKNYTTFPTTTQKEGFCIDDISVHEGPSCDLAVDEILLPSFPCQVEATDSLSIKIINLGSVPQSNFTVSYSLDSGLTFVNETIPQVIQPIDTFIYTFYTPTDFSATGTYNVVAKVQMACDTLTTNNVKYIQVYSIRKIDSLPYFENFDEGRRDWLTSNYMYDIVVPDPSGSSSDSCVLFDNIQGAFIYSPCFDFSSATNPTISFEINFNTIYTTEHVNIYYCINDSLPWTIIGNQGDDYNWYNSSTGWTGLSNFEWNHSINPWMYVEHTLPEFAGDTNVRFAIKVSSSGNPLYIDNFRVFDKIHDVRIAEIQPNNETNCNSFSQDTIKVLIVNNGAVPETNFPVKYSLDNGNSWVTETITDTINPSDSLWYPFSNIPDFSSYDAYYIKGLVNVSGDENLLNDTINTVLINYPVIDTFPYFQNFESTQYWHPTSTFGWHLDDPQNYGISYGQGQNAWIFDYQTPFQKEYSLESPCFDFTNEHNITIEYDFYHSISNFYYYILFQYSLDGGLTWNGITINSNSNYDHINCDVSFLAGHSSVKFRFYGRTDWSIISYKFFIDNFYIHTLKNDLKVLSISRANNNNEANPNEEIMISIRNEGSSPQTGFNVSYSIDSGYTFVEETVSDTLYYFDTLNYVFSTTADLSSPQFYYLVGAVLLASDTIPDNDTVYSTTFSLQTVSTFPYYQDFDSANSWLSNSYDSIWYLGTPAGQVIDYAASGNNCWFTSYPTTPNPNSPSFIYSPIFDFSQLPHVTIEMDVWWNTGIYDYWTGTFYGSWIQYSIDSGNTWVNIVNNGVTNWYNQSASWGGDLCSDWVHVKNVLPGLGGQQKVMFRIANSYPSISPYNYDGFAFDNVLIYGPDSTSFSSKSCNVLFSSCTPSANDTIEIVVKNVGVAPHNTIPVTYSIDGGNTFIPYEYISDTIYPNEEKAYRFSTPADLSAQGLYDIIAVVNYPGDTIFDDDSVLTEIYSYSQISNYPYFEDFEQPPLIWHSGGNNSTWELAFPAGQFITNAYSGNNCWVTNATGNYQNKEHSFVESPCFDFTGLTHPVLKIKACWDMENSKDGAIIQYSKDNSVSWHIIDGQNATNWYNDNDINALLVEGTETGWTGTNNNWSTLTTNLDSLAGEPSVKFRIVFASDFTGSGEGFAFDDVEIYEAYHLDVETVEISPVCNSCEGDKSIYAHFKNSGIDTVNSFNISWIVNGTFQNTVSFNGTLPPNADTIIEIGNYFFDNGIYDITVFSSLPNGMQDINTVNDTATETIEINNSHLDFSVSTNQDTICAGYDDAIFTVSGPYDNYEFWSSFSGGNILAVVTDSLIIDTVSNYYQNLSYWITTNINDTISFGQLTNMQQYGYMFDILLTQNITMDSIGIILNTNNVCNLSIYLCQGSYQGNETNPSVWTLVNHQMIYGQDPSIYKYLSFGGLEIDSGSIYGIYIYSDNNSLKGQLLFRQLNISYQEILAY